MMSLRDIRDATLGQLIGDDTLVRGVSTNSREDCSGKLFVALKGERFDAHDFLDSALASGASAVLVDHQVSIGIPQIVVDDTLAAYGQIAASWRAQFAIPVIGLTGSVGKTTVKEMLACIFSEIGHGLVTFGNLNNEVGVPQTLLRLNSQHQYAIIEMGMNHAGEIARLTRMTAPTIALVNNAAAAHLEGLGSVAAVADAKGEIYQGLASDGVAIINRDDDYAELWLELSQPYQQRTFGLTSTADVSATYKVEEPFLELDVESGDHSFTVRLLSQGEHSVRNALAAVTVALAANVDPELIARGLAKYRPVPGRLTVLKIGDRTVIDDSYNANPASMRAAIDVLASYPKSTLIIGDMAELGAAADSEHQKLGNYARDAGIDNLLVCGQFAPVVEDAFGPRAKAFPDRDALIAFLDQSEIPENHVVLVKGSRSAQMEQVIAFLQQSAEVAKADESASREMTGEGTNAV